MWGVVRGSGVVEMCDVCVFGCGLRGCVWCVCDIGVAWIVLPVMCTDKWLCASIG